MEAPSEQESSADLKRRQLDEVRRRREAVLSGRVTGVPSAQVLQEIAELLR